MAGTRAVSGLVTPHLSGCQPQTRRSATVRPMGLLVQSPLGHSFRLVSHGFSQSALPAIIHALQRH